ncbi:MAG: hypothetical protein ACK5Y2_12770, partial [Bdellovibrionales bacterium]
RYRELSKDQIENILNTVKCICINLNYQHPEILETLLVTAIKKNHTEVALYLLENGADPKLESYFDQLTPLKAALKFKNSAVLKKLEEMGVRKPWYRLF